ncbi:hypothetical protein NDU88_006763 [Pleurodeles waltl]|uniref:Uncharacterized protein n=1 Tax=Pleurodeles waltl TaxID=8319 RepID=A0AAV7WFQ9_PLEWA|nr:hypothetical protein NDU88_006763 [Pleurodeles waltl]
MYLRQYQPPHSKVVFLRHTALDCSIVRAGGEMVKVPVKCSSRAQHAAVGARIAPTSSRGACCAHDSVLVFLRIY